MGASPRMNTPPGTPLNTPIRPLSDSDARSCGRRRSEQATEAGDEQRRREQREFEHVRLHEALSTLCHSLAHNRGQLSAGQGLTKILTDGRAPWKPQLDRATWDAVQSDVVSLLHDPDLGPVKELRSFWDTAQKEWPLTGQFWLADNR
jgi:hypothetical protein